MLAQMVNANPMRNEIIRDGRFLIEEINHHNLVAHRREAYSEGFKHPFSPSKPKRRYNLQNFQTRPSNNLQEHSPFPMRSAHRRMQPSNALTFSLSGNGQLF